MIFFNLLSNKKVVINSKLKSKSYKKKIAMSSNEDDHDHDDYQANDLACGQQREGGQPRVGG